MHALLHSCLLILSNHAWFLSSRYDSMRYNIIIIIIMWDEIRAHSTYAMNSVRHWYFGFWWCFLFTVPRVPRSHICELQFWIIFSFLFSVGRHWWSHVVEFYLHRSQHRWHTYGYDYRNICNELQWKFIELQIDCCQFFRKSTETIDQFLLYIRPYFDLPYVELELFLWICKIYMISAEEWCNFCLLQTWGIKSTL